MPRNSDNFFLYSEAALLDLIRQFSGTRQEWAAAEARAELQRRDLA